MPEERTTMHIRPIPRRLLFLLLATLVAACAPQPEPPAQLAGPVRESAGDPHSYSRPDQVVVRHMTLDLDVDFESRRLRGSATVSGAAAIPACSAASASSNLSRV